MRSLISLRSRVFALTIVAIVMVVPPWTEPAGAQVSRDQQACINGLNDNLRRVALTVGKELGACITDAAKEKLGGDSTSECLAEDRRGKIAKATARTLATFGKKCTGIGKDGNPKLPAFGPRDPDTVNAVATDRTLAVIEAIFGSDANADGALALASQDKNRSKCQQAIVRAVRKCQDKKLTEFNTCKKSGLRGSGIEGVSGLLTCMGLDPKGKIQKACQTKLDTQIAKKCVKKNVDLDAAFPGCVTADPAALGECLDRLAECEVCEMLNRADGLSRDCDAFDDGIRNGSCGNEACEVLNATECLLPYPSTHFLAPANTSTGFRLNFPQAGVPEVNGLPTNVAPYNEIDGFSPMVHPLMHFPQGVDPELSNAARLLPLACCGQPPGPPWIDTRTFDGRSLDPDSPTLLIDAETGDRILHFIEADANASDPPERQVVFLRPGKSLRPARRYIVAMRNLKDADGNDVEAEPAFAALRDGLATTIPAVENRREYMETNVFLVLQHHGIPRQNLVLAFDFLTQSEHQLTHQMLAMRDQGYAHVADVAANPSAIPFVVNNVETHDCDVPGQVVWREVSGTFESPLFLTEDPDVQGAPLLNVDADDNPVQNGVTHPPFGVSIPCSALDGVQVSRPMVLGHGFLGSGVGMVAGTPAIISSAADWNYIAGGTNWIGFSSADLLWLVENIVGTDGLSRLNNFPALPDRLRQAMLNTLVLSRMMKLGLFNRDPAFRTPSGDGVFPGPSEEMFYYGVSLGGIMGLWFSALTPDIERFAVDVPTVNFVPCLTQRSTQFGTFAGILNSIGLSDPMRTVLMLALLHEIFVSAEPAGYALHITADPLPGSGTPSRILMLPAWLDKQVPNHCTEISARTLGIPNLDASIQQGLQEIPDLPGPLDSAMVMYDTGALDIANPLHEPFIPPLANVVPSPVCDPHGARRRIPAGILQLVNFLRPGGQIENFCAGAGNLCDADRPLEIANGNPQPCDPLP